ncbi:MAG: putative cytokinetic ring protein SteA [Nostocoides sp.]
MPIRLRTREPESSAQGLTGPARVDRRTKNLTKRLRPGEVAVIDHVDLDRVSAEALVACKPVAVVNAARSISGRYPNLGPGILIDAGIPLIDAAGPSVMSDIREGTTVTVDGSRILVDGRQVAVGDMQTEQSISSAMADARAGLSEQLEAFANNTMQYLRDERDLLLDGVGVPDIATSLDDRHVLIVVRGYHYKEDLQILASYIREFRPILIGVDGGADALIEAGHTPDLIVGDMDSVSDAALRSGAEVVVHAYRDGHAPGRSRVEELGITPVIFPAMGTSEDVAMLLADDKGAKLIVAVGTHATLVEFLDKGRAGMASTFLTRLRVGGKLVDAKGVSRLYRTRISVGWLVALATSAMIALYVALWATPGGKAVIELIGVRWDSFWQAIRELFS